MIKSTIATALLLATTVIAQPPRQSVVVVNKNLAPTPMMGLNTWAYYGFDATDALVRSIADGMVNYGMLSAGYVYLGIDDGWFDSSGRNVDGSLKYDATKFPNGMAALVSYVHGKGLKFGIYASGGTSTCGGYSQGSYGYEQRDAGLFASWGVDLLKLDLSCNKVISDAAETLAWVRAIQSSGRDIVLTTGSGTSPNASWLSAVQAQSGRICADIVASWASVSLRFTANSGISQFGGPNHWLDLDALMVGYPPVTNTEGRTAMSLWAIQAAPLIIGTDMEDGSNPSAFTLATLTNSDVIAVDQDALGFIGLQVSSVACGSATCQVWAKQLTGTNTCAIALFNLDSAAHDVTAIFSTVAATVPACGTGPYSTTKDLWSGTSLGTLTGSYTATSLAAHGSAVIRVAQ